MIQLAETVYYNDELPFDEQSQDVKSFIQQYYYENCLLLPPSGFDGATYEHEKGYTKYDGFKRPVEVGVYLENITIIGYRTYIDSSAAWKLHSELVTVKIS